MKFSGAFLTFLATLLEVKSFQGPQNLFRTSARQDRTGLDMAVMSPRQGIPAQVVEERDACGVGFIASLDQKSSHETLKHALDACNCMEHRGATSADNVSGDGAGIMTSIPTKLFSQMNQVDNHFNADGSSALCVGMTFLPCHVEERAMTMKGMEESVLNSGFNLVGWRDVPTDKKVLGKLSADFVPSIKQIVFYPREDGSFADAKALEKKLYAVRREIQGNFRKFKRDGAYMCSMSSRTIVYKGMLRSQDLSLFYKDLTDENYETNFVVYHRRFSTNTVPKWFLAQPMRLISHNGEINTLLGNINWMKARQYAKRSQQDDPKSDYFFSTDDKKAIPYSAKVRSPLVDIERSDSANLDSVFENYVRYDRDPEEAIMMLVPEAYQSQPSMKFTPEVADFYSYYESLQEAWDGPALLVFADGEKVGAMLDRNGLRPARYMVSQDKEGDKFVHLMSEVGVTKMLEQFEAGKESGISEDSPKLLESGRIGPGQILAVDLKEGTIKMNDEVKADVAKRFPYAEWKEKALKPVARNDDFIQEIEAYTGTYNLPAGASSSHAKDLIGTSAPIDTVPVSSEVSPAGLVALMTASGWGSEDVDTQISALAAMGVEATYSMGDDAPLAVLSELPHTLYDYFKQRFAQVTNPPIDPLREGAVMSTNMFLGPKGNVLSTSGQQTVRVKIDSPILNTAELATVGATRGVKLTAVSTAYPITEALSQGGLQAAVVRLQEAAVAAVKDGATVLDLTDRGAVGVDKDTTFIPPLMGVAAVHHGLIEAGVRTEASLVCSTAQAWSTHHMALLVGYGASAIVPYAAFDSVINWHADGKTQRAMERRDIPKLSAADALANYRKGVDKGILKILSKIGISLLTSYQGAQIFESLGINDDVLMSIFKGTPSRVSGLSFDDIAAEGMDFHRRCFGDDTFANMVERVENGPKPKLFNYGFLNFFKGAEFHHNNQPLLKDLHAAIRDKNTDVYALYEESVRTRPPTTIRDTLEFNIGDLPVVPLEEVESVANIMERFCSGGMSLGALSREAHETLAIGMNRIGGKSNSGEGGEDRVRHAPITGVQEKTLSEADGVPRSLQGRTLGVSSIFPGLHGLKEGDSASSKIKQIASGRFGVTPEYLMRAEQLEIKIAQGAKPGEGGQLPGKKVNEYIASVRASTPGVTLISPPPHHDIYSIEDLAQLIYDLHQINPEAGVSVKLVSEVGIGTVASGVAKAGADIIQISGHDGGTGASPASSIKHAGSPWELGVAESHATLQRNGLRKKVLLRADGGLKSGWDVVMAAAMGAEEFGFGTIAMVAEGCILARICHTNKCPVGVATQNEALRKRFPGTPDDVVTFFTYVAEEVRQILAKLGYRTLDEMIGKPGVLRRRTDIELKKASGGVDPSFVLDSLECEPAARQLDFDESFCIIDDRDWLNHGAPTSNGYTLCDKILEDNDVATAIASNDPSAHVTKVMHIVNTDRAALARVSGVLADKYGDGGFKGHLDFQLTGGAGQSFAAFLSEGMSVTLRGYANDYVCKGMAGGQVVIAPPERDLASASSNSLSVAGNTVLYGATGGTLNVRGRTGERFAVRNSGALGVVEGMGDHGCEYMTNGRVLSLGDTGRNFGAGMTGGLAFVVTDEGWLNGQETRSQQLGMDDLTNMGSVSLVTLSASHGAAKEWLAETLKMHIDLTGSARATRLLDALDEALSSGKITAVVPASEEKSPLLLASVPVSAAANV